MRHRLGEYLLLSVIAVLTAGSVVFVGYHAYNGLMVGFRTLPQMTRIWQAVPEGALWYFGPAGLMVGYLGVQAAKLAWFEVHAHAPDTGYPFAIIRTVLIVGLGMPLWLTLIGLGALAWPLSLVLVVAHKRRVRREEAARETAEHEGLMRKARRAGRSSD